MQPHERQLVLDQLASSEQHLLSLTATLTPEQWRFRESPDRWSTADNLEHVILVEGFLRAAVQRVLSEPPQPEKRAAAAAKEPLVHRIATARETKFNAREAVHPTGRWQQPSELHTQLHNTRAETIAWVQTIDGDLRNHFFAHVALGDLDCYQWLVVIAQHGARHALQIAQIQAHPDYPAAIADAVS